MSHQEIETSRTEKFLTWHWIATCKGIALISAQATANRSMMMDTTLGIRAADTWTGITTLLVNACLVLRTL